MKTVLVRAAEATQQLKTLAALAEGQSSVPRTHIRQVTKAPGTPALEKLTSPGLIGHCLLMHKPTHIHTHK